jgi:hypothetical protein
MVRAASAVILALAAASLAGTGTQAPSANATAAAVPQARGRLRRPKELKKSLATAADAIANASASIMSLRTDLGTSNISTGRRSSRVGADLTDVSLSISSATFTNLTGMNLTVAASPGSLVEDALQELESLGKQQNALREARDAFDVAIQASEEAKERAKKLAEEVVQTSEDIVDDDDDAGSAAAPATGAHTATSRAKRKWYDGVRTVGSFMLGGLISRLLQGGSCSPSGRSCAAPCTSACFPGRTFTALGSLRLMGPVSSRRKSHEASLPPP